MEPKINILVLTQPGSFTSLGNQLVKLLPYETRAIDWQKTRGEVCDICIATWWHPISRGLLDGLVINRATVGCVFDHFSWQASVVGREALRRAMGRFDVLVCGSEAILRGLRQTYGSLPPCFICETGADVAAFRPTTFPRAFTAMWCGNSEASTPERDLKGLKLIKEACMRAKVPLQIADSTEREGPNVSRRDMPTWYSQGSVYLCASESEGTPRPMLEALASGRPVVTARVGLASRLIHHGVNGVIVERSEEGLIGGLRYIKRLIESYPDQVAASCRQAAESWGEQAMASKWTEVVQLVRGGPWWKGLAATPEAPAVIRCKEGPKALLPRRRELEAKELASWNAPPDLLQQFVAEAEDKAGCVSGRPKIAIPTTYRFLSRTLYLLEHLVREYQFVVGEVAGADLVWNFYPFGDWAQRQGIPYVQTMRGQFWHMSQRIIQQSVEAYSHAAHIVTLTKSLHRDLATRYPQLAAIPHTVIHNGHFEAEVSQAAAESLPHQRPILLCVTNFHFEGKRRATVELSRELERRRFRGTFLVVAQPEGKGVPPPALSPRSHYLGFHQNRLALYREADVFLYHSYIDGQPTSVVEAMSAGLPVVVGTAPHSGAGEFVQPGKTGLTFSDPRDGVDKALRLLMRPTEAREMALNAKRWLKEHCTWMGAAAQYDRVFRGVLGSTG